MEGKVTPGVALLLVTILVTFVACSSPQRTVKVPAGTELMLALANPLNSAKDTVGTTFTAASIKDVVINGYKAVSDGDTFKATITGLSKSGNDSLPVMTIEFQYIIGPTGKPHPIHVRPITLEASADTSLSMPKIIGANAGGGGAPVRIPATDGKIELPEQTTFAVYVAEPTELPLLTDQ